MRKYHMHSLALTPDEDIKLQKVKNHYKDTGVKKIFMGMVNAMFSKIPIPSTTEETQGEGVNKSGIMRNFPRDVRNEETE
jgi:hypothetical protein